ncbi:alpha-1-acid glycoprotein 1 [Rousettus aegyptiacus]|uniref:alpha-1-acid glycoprotein 1 n=1 Tax=Rousettus aegyptiacus TaxID=9407 RepID=UPI00168D8ADE|nr:alpha-1-acid glycoprotein 1 [Rousettus aegyptiacus]
MGLPWALAVLSLLPLLSAQNPECFNFTVPLTNVTLDQITGKWFYLASAIRNPEFKKIASTLQSVFFYLAPNYTENTVLAKEYWTIENKCMYNVSNLKIQWENGTLSKYRMGEEIPGYLVFTKDPRIFMITFYPEDKQKMSLSLYADKPVGTEEQMREFYETVACMGMDKSEIIYTDEKKDQCGPLEKQQEEGKKQNEGSPENTEQG